MRAPGTVSLGRAERMRRRVSWQTESDIRPGEVAIELPAAFDAGVYFIGRIRTPFKTRADCPKNIAEIGCRRPGRARSALCGGPARPRALLARHPALLDGQGPARPDPAGAGAPGPPARHLRAALAGAAEPDRAGRGRGPRHRRHHRHRAQRRLLRRHAARSTSSPTSPPPTASRLPCGPETAGQPAPRSRNGGRLRSFAW